MTILQNKPVNKNLQQWLEFLEQAHPVAIDLNLERIFAVLHLLKLPKLARHIITVGGTNGKGTTCKALEELCLAHHLTVGVYSSPHLLKYNERVRMNRQNATDEALIEAFELIHQIKGDISLTYFEVGTLAALILFAQASLDIVILEVGMGGKFDATNIVDSDLQILTNVDLDHTNFLGCDINLIGLEKVGIARRFTPFVYGDFKPLTTVLEYANNLSCRLSLINQDFTISGTQYQDDIITLALPQTINIPLNNVALAIRAFLLLNAVKIDEKLVYQALDNIALQGRMQKYNIQGKTVIVDVAHNPHSAKYLAYKLQNSTNIAAVFSALNDKDIAGILEPFKTIVAKWHLFELDNPRKTQLPKLEELLQQQHLPYQSFATAKLALDDALLHYDNIIAFGSFSVVEEVVKQLENIQNE
jgi:dihydrofolate synthase/folylpolyglutamate synthase